MDEMIVTIKDIYLEDGRKAEKHVKCNGEKTITEIHVEPKISKKLEKRIIETKKPIIVERIIEDIDENGNIISRDIEKVDSSLLQATTEFVTKKDFDIAINKILELIESIEDNEEEVIAALDIDETDDKRNKYIIISLWTIIIVEFMVIVASYLPIF